MIIDAQGIYGALGQRMETWKRRSWHLDWIYGV